MRLSPLAKKLFLIMSILAVIGSVTSWIVWPHMTNIIPGILLGMLVAMVRFCALEYAVDSTLHHENSKKAAQMAKLSYALRQLLTGVVFLIAALNSTYINLLGAFFGVATLQIAIHIYNRLERKQPTTPQ